MQNTLDNTFLGTEPVKKVFIKLAIPAIVAQIVNLLYNMVDRVYIGRIEGVGSTALTGVGVCLPIILVLSAFAALFSMGGAPKASAFMGSGENDKAEITLGNSFTLIVIISAILTATLLIFSKDLLMLVGASENTIGYADSYMQVYCLGTVFVLLSMGLNSFISAQGFAKTSMATVCIGAVCNIILDPILIYTCNMGVAGAALATIISQAVSAVWVLAFLTGKKTILKLRAKFMKINFKIILPTLALGLSPFIMQATESIITICFNASLLRYGGDIAVGSMTILNSVMMFSILPLQGLAQGAQPVSAYNFGALNSSRVKQMFKILLTCMVTYSLLLWASVMIAPQLFASIFTTDQALIEYTKTTLRIYMSVSCIFSVQIACQMTFISIGEAKASLFLAILRKIVLLVPLIYILPLFLPNQVYAVILAEPITDLIAVTTTVILFKSKFTKAMAQIDAEAAAKQNLTDS